MKIVRLLSFLLLTFTVTAQAQFTYVTNNGAITITGYNCPGSAVAVTIPGTINGLPVTNLGRYAFFPVPN